MRYVDFIHVSGNQRKPFEALQIVAKHPLCLKTVQSSGGFDSQAHNKTLRGLANCSEAPPLVWKRYKAAGFDSQAHTVKPLNISRALVGNKIVDNSDVVAYRRCSNY